MSATGLPTFDTTLQETNVWLRGLMDELGMDDRHAVYIILRATLHALRDRIGPESSVHLGAQLPMLLRGLFYENWHMAGTPTKEHNRQQFLDHVRRELPAGLAQDTERAVRAVFLVMWERLESGEIAKIIGLLPRDLRELWPTSARRA